MMVTVPLALLVQRNHEQVGADELAQEPGGTFPARHRVAKRTRHRPQTEVSSRNCLTSSVRPARTSSPKRPTM